jgi:membrane protease YdiL (CAAX protease family)
MTAQPDPHGPAPWHAAAPESVVASVVPARWRPRTAIAVVALAVVLIQVVWAAMMLAAGGDDASNEAVALTSVLADLVVLAIIVTFAARGADKLTPATLGVRRSRFWRSVGWALAIWLGVLALEGLWALVVGGYSNVEEDPNMTDGELVLILFAVAVVAPIVEELTFRGYLFPALAPWRGPWVAAAVTAVLFGAAHVVSSPVAVLPALAIFGFGACLLFWFTGSLLPCVGLHAANNALVMTVGGGWTWEVPVALIACVTVAILVLLPFARRRAPRIA